jgi:S1-C subfamily serine protease
VQADSPARKAGLEPGTVIRQVGDITIESLRRLRDIAPQLSGPLELVVVSDGEEKVTLP